MLLLKQRGIGYPFDFKIHFCFCNVLVSTLLFPSGFQRTVLVTEQVWGQPALTLLKLWWVSFRKLRARGITKGCKVAGTWDKGRTGEGGLCCLVPSASQQFKTQLQRSPLGILQRTFSLLSTGLFTPFSPSFPLIFCFPVLSKTNFVFWSSVFRSLYCEKHFTLFTYLFDCAGS